MGKANTAFQLHLFQSSNTLEQWEIILAPEHLLVRHQTGTEGTIPRGRRANIRLFYSVKM